jgi:hypothetical protein
MSIARKRPVFFGDLSKLTSMLSIVGALSNDIEERCVSLKGWLGHKCPYATHPLTYFSIKACRCRQGISPAEMHLSGARHCRKQAVPRNGGRPRNSASRQPSRRDCSIKKGACSLDGASAIRDCSLSAGRPLPHYTFLSGYGHPTQLSPRSRLASWRDPARVAAPQQKDSCVCVDLATDAVSGLRYER